jgi:biopolymer transport protein ExbD
MIPLIDISLVLLVFFMMTTVVSVSSPVSVPEMRYAEELAKESQGLSIWIDRRSDGEPFYSIRLGDSPVQAEDNNLPGLRELLARLDLQLAQRREPPEVRIACHAELPSRLVHELVRELDSRRRNQKIRVVSADVNEGKK